MKRTFLFVLLILPMVLIGQNSGNPHSAQFELGSGLTFSFNDGDYIFSLGGMVQPSMGMDKVQDSKAKYFFNSRRSYFNISGAAVNEKIDFCIRMDFSLSRPLLDVYMSYKPFEFMSLTLGQKQSPGKNLEMLLIEDHLQFADRSLLSTAYSRSGREFGAFLEANLSLNNFVIKPTIAVTSGDGSNSFGIDSRDLDLGGIKYAARVDLYPFGPFAAGNGLQVADLAEEIQPKLAVGFAASLNKGASDLVGEGHGQFYLYDAQGQIKLPDYRQLYADILVKWKGFSLLGEYNISTAAALDGSFTAETGHNPLVPTEISEYLALGHGYHVQLGYVLKKAYGLDLSYSAVSPEFKYNPDSKIKEKTAYTIGLSRYFKGNDLKMQLSGSLLSDGDNQKSYRGDLIVQLRI